MQWQFSHSRDGIDNRKLIGGEQCAITHHQVRSFQIHGLNKQREMSRCVISFGALNMFHRQQGFATCCSLARSYFDFTHLNQEKALAGPAQPRGFPVQINFGGVL